MKKNNKNVRNNDYLGCLKALWIPIIVFTVLLYQFTGNNLSDNFYNKHGTKTTAHINRDKHGIANSKVITERSFTSGYEFEVSSKMYYGNSRTRDLPYGYAVEVEYVSFFPYWNRVKK